MSQILVSHLTFSYENSFDVIFDDVSFVLDTDWKLGFTGRNGKGKTTFLRLLQGKYLYEGTIRAGVSFDYFPYSLSRKEKELMASELLEGWKPGCEEWRVILELSKLGLDAEVLYRPFGTLSQGEQTKVMLAVLFSGEQEFLLIDEPTNHLDQEAREKVKTYLAGKKGFILVSHDRDLLDACIDHILVLNRKSIEVQNGNFSSWEENKRRQDVHAKKENEKHRKEIAKLEKAARQAGQWSDQVEKSKIGQKEAGIKLDRGYVGHKAAKMMKRAKTLERRKKEAVQEKEGLLKDVETLTELKMQPLVHHRDVLVRTEDYGLRYPDAGEWLFQNLRLEIRRGERVFLHGANGCGKSTIIKAVLKAAGYGTGSESSSWNFQEQGRLMTASGIVISYVGQDTSYLKGNIRQCCEEQGLDASLFCTVLRKMGVGREQFEKDFREYSEGQKKKVQIAKSLLTPAHLYLWDEPLNYVDVFTRMQIEELLLKYEPAMLIVEHDARFRERIATKIVELSDRFS
nr:ABC-F type ribosomal protection protein [uncultured Merdimonas sp.]